MRTDECGTKVAPTAAANGVTPQEWTHRIAAEFTAAWKSLEISNTDFIRTTQPRHRVAVEEMICRMQAKGDLYRDTYAGFYCVGCESYKSESDLVDGRCPEHPSLTIEWMEEEDWFFRLSKYQDALFRFVYEGVGFIQLEARRYVVRRMNEEIK